MLVDALMALASLAGGTVVAAASTDAWELSKDGITRLLGHGDPGQEQLVSRRLEQTREQLTRLQGTERERVRSALAVQWTMRLADLLQESPSIEAELRALTQQIHATLPAGMVSAADLAILAGKDVNISADRGIAGGVVGDMVGGDQVRGVHVGGDNVGGVKIGGEPRDLIERAVKEAADQPAGQRARYLKGQCPEIVPVGEPFSLLVSIVLAGHVGAGLKLFDVPPEGRDVLLVIHAPGLQFLGRQRMTVHVPRDEDSEPVMFELRADTPGPRPASVTAWLGGSYLGELLVEVSAERDRPSGANRDVLAEIITEPANGAVSLVVRYDPRQNTYRFEFRDEDNPEEVTSNLAYEPGPRVEQLIAELDYLAKDRTGYSAAQTRNYLVNSGAALWQELLPERLRQQYWERQHRIRQLTILADKDAVPWELLYPMDPGHDAGFLVEQFPVTRAVFGRMPTRRLRLRPARFVLPEGSPPEARAEIEVMRQLLDPNQSPQSIIAALTPLQDLISSGRFGLLHFACHNRFNAADGSSITLDKRPFTPTLMTAAAINHVLAASAPTVFINACRSAGLAARYNRLDGWARKFLEAGAAVFIGSLWAVSDSGGREFANTFYRHLQHGVPLGEALLSTRKTVAGTLGDPTWLAYAVYGDPGAMIRPTTPLSDYEME